MKFLCLDTHVVIYLFLFLSIYEAKAIQEDSASITNRPNIVLIVADDLGYGDLSCFGHPVIKTPNLDRLSLEGMKFMNSYSGSAVCSPSRAAIMTGRNPYRVGVYNWIPMMSPMHLPASETAIPEILKQVGYSTAMFGKWHLNGLFNLPGQPQPDDFGFDHWFAVQNNALPNHKNPYNFVRNRIPQGPINGFSGPIVARNAVDWLQNIWDRSNPFFLYVAFNEPHEPIATAERYKSLYIDKYPDDPSRAAYYGNVTQMDDALGQILEGLDSMEITENTLVWFTSDHGPARTRYHNAGSTNGLRGYKQSLYEGGIRVPTIVRWPRVIKAGSINKQANSGIDIFQTICDIVNVSPASNRELDGTSIVPLFIGEVLDRKKPLFWKYLWAISDPKFALLQDGWKLLAELNPPISPSGSGLTDKVMELIKNGTFRDFELYNLNEDPYETNNLANVYPKKVDELSKIMKRMNSEIQADAPIWPAWQSAGYEGSRIEWPDYVAKPIKD